MRYKIEACCLTCKYGIHQNENKMACNQEVSTDGTIEVQPAWWCIEFVINPHIDAIVDL